MSPVKKRAPVLVVPVEPLDLQVIHVSISEGRYGASRGLAVPDATATAVYSVRTRVYRGYARGLRRSGGPRRERLELRPEPVRHRPAGRTRLREAGPAFGPERTPCFAVASPPEVVPTIRALGPWGSWTRRALRRRQESVAGRHRYLLVAVH